ncbi:hypothetical protein H4R99_007816 [Coemansia sp. RSA 1722]|nr:hypothetical protein H4R99_007816 [Coemansia sp. RSA 1722]
MEKQVDQQQAKVLVSGSINGGLADFFAKISKLDTKYGPFSVMLVTGNMFGSSSDDDKDVEPLLNNEISVPIMTYVSVGDRALPPRIEERISLRSGEICNNLVVLRGHGVLQTTEGVKIAYIGGRYALETPDQQIPEDSQPIPEHKEGELKEEDGTDMEAGQDEQRPDSEGSSKDGADASENGASDNANGVDSEGPRHISFDRASLGDLISRVAEENTKAFEDTEAQPSIDILLSYDWPYGVSPKEQMGDNASQPREACNKISYAAAAIMPRYHFAAAEQLFFERFPWKYNDRIRVGPNRAKSVSHFTRFVGLGSVNASEHGKQRWFYAMNVSPLQAMRKGLLPPSELPANCTPNPLYQFGKLTRPLQKSMVGRIVSDLESNHGMGNGNGNGNGKGGDASANGSRGKRPPPPLDYVCRSCNQPGHWISDCPTREQVKRQRTDASPPDGYICHKCKQPGHWRPDCPAGAADDGAAATADMLAKCWFCLANPDVDQNLMVAIGDEAYVAISKGALVVSGSDGQRGFDGYKSPIPGGGHVLVVPIAHIDSLRKARQGSSDADRNLCAEIDKWVGAVSALYAEYDCVPFVFETCRCLPHVHTSIQMIPIPKARLAAFNDALKDLCRDDKLDIKHQYPESASGGYFAFNDLSLVDGEAGCSQQRLYIHIRKKARSFNLQFGRKLAARVLGVPEREDWKRCVVADDIEAKERDRFIAAFAAHDFSR